MKCMYCGTPLSSIDYCTGCGADVTIQKRTNRISNLLYNEGLEKASVRDLSGAISCLKRSLKFNKENVDARNLLGLVYYETGEVVAALSEWVISNNTVPENNPANFYISKLQENKNKLDMINQTIRKYNQALDYCKQHDEDMALIQLKKVLAQNPNLIKGYHLLALIYLKDQEYEKARKVLKKAAQIDTTNTMTLRYLHEVEEATGVGTNLNTKTKRFRKKTDAEEKVPKILGPLTYMNGNDTVIQPTTFRDSSTAATFLNIFLGFLLGAAVVWFLAIPANTRKINQQASAQVTDANTKLAASTSQIDSLQAKIDEYQAQVDAANSTADSANTKAQSYDSLLKAASEFLSGNQTGTASAMADIKADSLTDSAKTLYDLLMNSVKSTVYSNLYTEGTTAYASGNYATAAEKLKEATETDATQYDAWYYLGFAYYNQGDTANADKTFAYIVNNFPASAGEVSQYITNSAALNSTDA
ncbi:MAG: tetratricopeptide repeat protein, partial [Eubacteriales bacterium]|nr:tetratricopeptide repeat protein [Eubacteriales bacterium]